ncbi:hypothetical protein QRN89_35450 (plasmid) [Streptomyces chengbuensis]|uniref:hypothetical protein n=1 Tax=Streptomyces TaxID=1883 RepID=UPI0025B410D0|nr:hypothetical protein [Streptomyces sp. HUAS CB01]WJY55095.1 hypothetical protein QRN89_35450 [Streptomyces sp. HUAS CB01]
MPDDRDFAAKGDLAKAGIQRLLASPLPITGETVDSVYGQEWRLRRMLEEAGVDYSGRPEAPARPRAGPDRPLHRRRSRDQVGTVRHPRFARASTAPGWHTPPV